MKKPSKYRNRMVVGQDGTRYASQAEYRRHRDLKLQEKAGAISDLKYQESFTFERDGVALLIRSKGYPNGRKVRYVADFTYQENGEFIVEEFKGRDQPLSRLKRALMEWCYGYEIRVTGAASYARARKRVPHLAGGDE